MDRPEAVAAPRADPRRRRQIVPFEVDPKRAAELIVGAELLVYEGSGHALPDTDRLNKDLLEFIER